MSASPFKVPVRELPTHRHVEVGGPFVAAALSGLAVREALEAPADDPDAGKATLDVDLYADGTSVFANGRMKGAVRVACGRCIAPVDVAFDEKIHVTYLPRHELETDEEPAKAAEASPSEDGVELEEEDLDLFPYDGEVVDLEPLVREQVILAVPYAPLCKEECKGLCAQCGADLNQGPCPCEKPVDPRFAALKGLKLPS